jgi:hypothetical protein
MKDSVPLSPEELLPVVGNIRKQVLYVDAM